MEYIYDLKTIHNGKVFTTGNKDIDALNYVEKTEPRQLKLECCSMEKCKAAFYYYFDTKLLAKVCIGVYQSRVNSSDVIVEVSYFKAKNFDKPYLTKKYPRYVGLPKKYYTIIKYIDPSVRQAFTAMK